MKSVVAVVAHLFFVWSIVQGDRHLNQNGPFRKRHTLGDEPSPYACDRGSGSSLSTNASIANINVSSTNYSSGEQINISWTPIPSPCSDEFILVKLIHLEVSGRTVKDNVGMIDLL